MSKEVDIGWVKSAFLLPHDSTVGGDKGVLERIYSTSMQDAADTTLGGSFVINPLPQFTRYADLKHNMFSAPADRGGQLGIRGMNVSNATSDTSSNGMGRKYHEKIKSNAQVVHFRVGVPRFNSLTGFYANYYSVPAASLARTGRAPGFFYNLGWAAGSVATIPLIPFIMTSKVIRFFVRRPASKYYSLKPTMYPYWSAVSSMVNGIAANMGIIPRPIYGGVKHLFDKEDGLGSSPEEQARVVADYHRHMPSIYRKNGGFDIYAIAQRGQKLVNARRELLNDELNKATDRDEVKAIFQRRLYGSDIQQAARLANNTTTTLDAYREVWANSAAMGGEANLNDAGEESIEKTLDITSPPDWVDSAITALGAEARMGSEFISFRVDYTGTQSETFSNSVKEPSISTQINSISASARETRFSVFDGNLMDNAVGSFIQGSMGAIKDFFQGAASSIGFQGLAQLAGSAYVDIPKVWDSSSCDFNKLTLTIPLRSPYGDPMSRMQNLIIPMCSLFAMAVPLATGKQSHTSPFLVEYFAQGRAHSRLAIVDSLQFTRGVGDVGWNNVGGFLGVDCTISLLDLSDAVNMPLNPVSSLSDDLIRGAGYAVGAAADTALSWAGEVDTNFARTGGAITSAMLASTYDDDNNYTDYLAILAGLPLEAEINMIRKWSIRLAAQAAKFDDLTSPERIAMQSMDGYVGEVIKAVSMATDRQ